MRWAILAIRVIPTFGMTRDSTASPALRPCYATIQLDDMDWMTGTIPVTGSRLRPS